MAGGGERGGVSEQRGAEGRDVLVFDTSSAVRQTSSPLIACLPFISALYHTVHADLVCHAS